MGLAVDFELELPARGYHGSSILRNDLLHGVRPVHSKGLHLQEAHRQSRCIQLPALGLICAAATSYASTVEVKMILSDSIDSGVSQH